MSARKDFPLKEPLPFNFRPFDRKLYRAIQGARGKGEAREAFEKLTRGKRAIDSSQLLLHVAVSCCSTDPPREHAREHPWMESWKDQWDGLGRAAKSIRVVAEKVEKHLAKSQFGPAPLAYMGLNRWDKEYEHGLNAPRVLKAVPEILLACADCIGGYCAMQKKWLAEWPTVRGGLTFQTMGLLRWIKERTGRNYFERVAALQNVARKLRGFKPVTGESLRKLWNTHSKRPWPRYITSV